MNIQWYRYVLHIHLVWTQTHSYTDVQIIYYLHISINSYQPPTIAIDGPRRRPTKSVLPLIFILLFFFFAASRPLFIYVINNNNFISSSNLIFMFRQLLMLTILSNIVFKNNLSLSSSRLVQPTNTLPAHHKPEVSSSSTTSYPGSLCCGTCSVKWWLLL